MVVDNAMEPTLTRGQEFAAHAVAPGAYEPMRGDIVVFHPPASWRQGSDPVRVMRLIAVAGDRVACCDMKGFVVVNGKALDEPYVSQNSPLDVPPRDCGSRRFDEVAIQPGQLFVMGDNRSVSKDSRCQEPVPLDKVVAWSRPDSK